MTAPSKIERRAFSLGLIGRRRQLRAGIVDCIVDGSRTSSFSAAPLRTWLAPRSRRSPRPLDGSKDLLDVH